MKSHNQQHRKTWRAGVYRSCVGAWVWHMFSKHSALSLKHAHGFLSSLLLSTPYPFPQSQPWWQSLPYPSHSQFCKQTAAFIWAQTTQWIPPNSAYHWLLRPEEKEGKRGKNRQGGWIIPESLKGQINITMWVIWSTWTLKVQRS